MSPPIPLKFPLFTSCWKLILRDGHAQFLINLFPHHRLSQWQTTQVSLLQSLEITALSQQWIHVERVPISLPSQQCWQTQINKQKHKHLSTKPAVLTNTNKQTNKKQTSHCQASCVDKHKQTQTSLYQNSSADKVATSRGKLHVADVTSAISGSPGFTPRPLPIQAHKHTSTLYKAGWQKLHGSTGGTRQKVLTRTKILSPNIRYFVAN